ncbi:MULTISPECIES: sugar phosphate isomerase/epimerase family protein [Pseudomonas]|uniref:Sugar phosphate isomerase/epimerase n=1 Tax=Pseudomonas quercus TaxID=2722792 RepID=A0ABX0YKE5_9PSED|nr:MULTISPECIES: sugar phosphate isomerase/epimerase [Pseudomonas]MBF7143938.1 sugar phosphate isomerase/epimerase [Pseudomonas sp. LY10J]NJP02478.1 sugar phosphate isomerase/epimerase [Pseudomonas quercus]
MTQRVFSLAALTVLELSPVDMIEVAARAGYSHVGLRTEPATAQEHHFALLNDPYLRKATLQRLKDTGVKVLDLEILRLKPETDIRLFEPHLAFGAQCGATELLVAGNDPDLDRCAARFAALCELAIGYGLHPHLEFMPWTQVPDLATAAQVVAQAGQPNGCILVDAFHFNRSGSHLSQLEQLPVAWMRYAQLCDIAGPAPTDMDQILYEARHERCLPGEGDCDLPGLLQALPKGIAISVEIPTRRLMEQGKSALERATLALDATRRVLERL